MKLWTIALLIVTVAFSSLAAAELSATAKEQIKEEVTAILAQIDSRQLGARLQDREFVVALYQQLLDRNPSKEELDIAELFLRGDRCCDDPDHEHDRVHVIKISRSHLLACLLAMKGDSGSLSYQLLAENLPLLRNLDLEEVPFWKPHVFAAVEKKEAKELPVKAHVGEYQVYHGYLHSHTSFSDGEGTPEEAYAMVRDVAGMDFFAVTDHAILLDLFPWENEWQTIKDTADRFHQDHEFVALYGFEWSSPVFGHINVLNSEDITNCVEALFVTNLCDWLALRPQAISRFNHPGRDPIGMEFDHFALHPVAVQQMVAVEMFSKGRGIDRFIDEGYFGDYNYLDEANQRGWKLGTVGGQDNHDKDWGMRNAFNVGVWATELTREGILEAYRERRTYACEDLNLTLSVKLNGAQMGSRLRSGRGELVVDLADGDRENFVRVDVYQKGVVVKTYEVKSSAPQIRHPVEAKTGDYYYVLATQEDGDMALSSPIWIVE